MRTPLLAWPRMRRIVGALWAYGLLTIAIAVARVGPDKLDAAADFHIAAGTLESALLEFSQQAALQVIIVAPVAHIQVVAISGRRVPRQVLNALLHNTGLVYRVVGDTVTVRKAEQAPHPGVFRSQAHPSQSAGPTDKQ
jgi:hemoglobin/transferrin/lactoferrin receptor protein